MTRRHAVVLAFACALAGAAQADLKQAKAEPNLEKRSKLALDNAETCFQAMRAAYEKNDNSHVAAAVSELRESVEVAYTSLTETGKDPRKSPKWFKRAEIQTRDLLRRLDAFQRDMQFEDRAMLDDLKARTQQVHDDLLMGLMEGKRRQ